MRFVSLIPALILAATPALAQQTPAAMPAPDAKAAERKICRKVETTGTILGGKRECHTKAEWARMNEDQRDARENSGARSSGMNQFNQ
jgi:hypothetical protein